MFRTLPIKTRLIMSGIISIASVLLTAGLGFGALLLSSNGLEHQIAATNILQLERDEFMLHDSIKADVLHAVLVGPNRNSTEADEMAAELAEDTTALDGAIAKLQGLNLPGNAMAEVLAIAPLAKDYIASALQIGKAASVDEAAGRALVADFNVKFYALEADAIKFRDTIKTLDDDGAAQSQRRNLLTMYVLIAATLTAAALLTYTVRKTFLAITRPIERLRDALRKVSQGDFGLRIGNITRDDYIGAIARDIDLVSDRMESALKEQTTLRAQGEHAIRRLGAGLRDLSAGNLGRSIKEPFAETYEPLRRDFNESVAKLNDLITQILQVGESIQSRSTQMNRNAEDLATRTENQAATLEETAAALEEMTASVNSAAENAKQVETVVLRTRQDVETSNAVVQGAVSAMNEIESSSSQISQIIGVIDDIAFQTNLLALNAGVEAARAGDAGRGFAVVASEVRALAQRSSLAAKEIKTLISASSQHVQRGVEQVDGAGKALQAVIDRVAQISSLVSSIASGAREQALGLNEINAGVAQLDQVTQRNASMVQDSGVATQALGQDVVGMNQMVRQFTVRSGSATTSRDSVVDPKLMARSA